MRSEIDAAKNKTDLGLTRVSGAVFSPGRGGAIQFHFAANDPERRIRILSTDGRFVADIAGDSWDGRPDGCESASCAVESGVYFYTITSGSAKLSGSFLVVK